MRGNHELVVATDVGDTLSQVCLFAPKQARKSVFGKRVRHRGDCAEGSGRISTKCDGDRIGFTWPFELPVAKIQCATAMGQPAHN